MVDTGFLSKIFAVVLLVNLLVVGVSIIVYDFVKTVFKNLYPYFLESLNYVVYTVGLAVILNNYLHRRFASIANGSWRRFNVLTLTMLCIVLAIMLSYYTYTLLEIAGKLGGRVDELSMYFNLSILSIMLLYHFLTPIAYALWSKPGFLKLSVARRFLEVLKTGWRLRGSFIIYLFIGFLVTSLLGFLVDVLTGISYMLSSLNILLVLVVFIRPVLYTPILYLFYTVFIKDYVLSVIEYVHIMKKYLEPVDGKGV